MKKILVLVLALAMVFGLMGCSKKDEPETVLSQDELIQFYVTSEYGTDELTDSEYIYKVTNVSYDMEDPDNTTYTIRIGTDRFKSLVEDGEEFVTTRGALETYYEYAHANNLEKLFM